MKQITVTTCDITAFNRQCEDLLTEGWIKCGSLSTAITREEHETLVYYSQVFVMKKDLLDNPDQTKMLL